MSYNTSQIDNATGLDTWLANINEASNGLPTISVLILLWVGAFVFATARNLNAGEAYTASSFLTAIIASLFYFAGMTSLSVLVLCIVMFFIGIGYLMFK